MQIAVDSMLSFTDPRFFGVITTIHINYILTLLSQKTENNSKTETCHIYHTLKPNTLTQRRILFTTQTMITYLPP